MRRRPRRGAFVQVLLFTSIWAVASGTFGLAARLPFLVGVLHARGMGLDGLTYPLASQLTADERIALLSASSGATLAVAVATLLATLLAIWIMRRHFEGPRFLDLGLRRGAGWLLEIGVGLALGPVAFLSVLLVLLAAGWASVGPGSIDARGLLMALASFVLVAVSEELFSRGWVLSVLERGRGMRTAVVGSAAVFSLLHGFNPGVGLTALIGLFLAGLLLAQAVVVTRRLWLPMALHLSWNVSEGPLLGFSVSGLPSKGLLTVTPTGPDVVTGGSFGPEAGLVIVVGIAVAAGAVWGLGRRRQARQG